LRAKIKQNNFIHFIGMSNSHTIVGHKIKGIRESKNLTVEEIAERSGLSVEQIISIESDQNLPSLGPLIKVARALGVRLGTFLDDSDSLGPVVTRAAERERDSSISFSNGAVDARKHMEYHPLAQQKAGRHMEPFVIDINPEEVPNFQLSAHEGEEFIYVMQGEVEIVYGKDTYNLKEGDSIFYDSIVKHHVHGAPGKSAKILAVVYIPF
jgi:transcriptional regulator with XRE-family HTH domain